MKHSALIRLFILIFLALVLGLGFMAPVLADSGNDSTPTTTPTSIPTANNPGAVLSISGVQPNIISNVVPTEIVVTGSGFIEGATVILGSSGSLPTTFVSANLLRAMVPEGLSAGVYSLIVINPDATSFTLANALTITAPAGPTNTPQPTNTPAPTAFVRPLLVVQSYGASAAEIIPNSDLDFEMTLANSGAIRASNIIVTFISGDFIARSTGGVRSLGSLEANQVNRFWQPLHAADGLPNGGIATLQAKVDYTDVNGTSYSETFSLTFPVRRLATGGVGPTATPTITPSPTATPTISPRLRPQLIVTGYETSVEQLEPGMHFSLSLTAQNQGNANAERITMIVGGGTASGGDLNGTPTSGGGVSGAGGEFSKFAPVGASNVQTLGNLAQGESLSASMAFIVNAATEPGAYPVKVSFVYEDSVNGDYVDDQIITLLVVKRPSVEMSFYGPPPIFFAFEPGGLSLQIINTSNKTVSLGTFSVSAADAIIENGSVFVGNLEPGGFYPLDAFFLPNGEGSQDIELTINYTDDFGQKQIISQTLSVEVMPAFVFEEPIEEPIDVGPLPEPEAETPMQSFWRFILGLIGLSSGQPQPDDGGFDVPPPVDDLGPGVSGPGISDPGVSGPAN